MNVSVGGRKKVRVKLEIDLITVPRRTAVNNYQIPGMKLQPPNRRRKAASKTTTQIFIYSVLNSTRRRISSIVEVTPHHRSLALKHETDTWYLAFMHTRRCKLPQYLYYSCFYNISKTSCLREEHDTTRNIYVYNLQQYELQKSQARKAFFHSSA